MSRTHETAHGYDRHIYYRLTCAEMDALIAWSDNRCGVCNVEASATPTGRLAIDHDHALGNWAVRGLLCRSCNVSFTEMLGPNRGFQWRRELREPAVSYLANPFRRPEHGVYFQPFKHRPRGVIMTDRPRTVPVMGRGWA